MKIKYKLKKLYPGIYHCEIKDSYDLAMTFCRVQEFYESPFKEIRNKPFRLLELMSIYSKRMGDGYFGYPVDWCGFNIPGKVIDTLYSYKLDDINIYDCAIVGMVNTIKEDNHHAEYYLIGSNGDKSTILHEMCHGLYALHPEYKRAVDKLTSKLPVTIYKKITDVLLDIGYAKPVLRDEVQAYLSTDYLMMREALTKKEQKEVDKLAAAFKLNFKHYTRKVKL